MNETEQLHAWQAMARAASAATRCADAYVALVVNYRPEGAQYVMWAAAVAGGLTYHRLDCANTSQERLIAHLAGFVENQRRAWGGQGIPS